LRRLPFRYLEPAFFGGLLDDPLLFVRIRPERQALLFDCGQIAHLAKRVVKPITAVFISHAHMDHIMGVPTLVRHHHASPLPLDLYGPPGVAERIDHLLHGFDWNLCEPTWFTLRVHEIHGDRLIHVDFPGPEAFVRRYRGEEPRSGRFIWASRYVIVEAELLDHKIPSLAFRITERPPFVVDPVLLEEQGLVPGEWISDLKNRVWKGLSGAPLVILQRQGSGCREAGVDDPALLYASIRKEQRSAVIGYLSDVGWTEANQARLETFFKGVTLLCSECTFLAADREKARASYHLCTADLNTLVRRLTPQFLLPMHLSKSYLRRTANLYDELAPPADTTVLRLPNHVVPAPLMADKVEKLLRA
jgi:ribonuclease Z